MKRLALLTCSVILTTVSFSSPATLSQPLPQSPEPSQQTDIQPSEGNAESNAESNSETLKVGTKEIVPFVFVDEQVPYGYSIDVWNEISRALDVETEWIRYNSVSQMLEALSTGEIDAAIAGISITAEREAAGFDFSYPFYRSGLQLMIQTPGTNRWRAAFGSLLSWKTWKPFLQVMATK